MKRSYRALPVALIGLALAGFEVRATPLLGPTDLALAFDLDLVVASSYPVPEGPARAIDGNVNTKYLNFGERNAGFIVTPTSATTVRSLRLTTANDAAARDPASWALYGTNQAIASTDNSAGNAESWTLIDSGGVALPDSRLTAGPAVTVNNANSYSSYRLVFPTVKDSNSANSVQIAEVQLFESTDASTQPILSPGNPILAVHLGSSQSSSPLLEGPASAVDGNVSTKYLNFGEARAGLILGPSIGPETVVTSFVITTANDSPERDPSSFELYGTNDPIMSPNHGLGIEGGEVWTLLASGLIDLPLARLTAGAPVAVSNADPYSAYRIIFPSVRNEAAANSVQFAEIQFDGQVVSDGGSVPEPASWALVLLTLSLLAACRRRSFALRRRG